MQRDRCVGELGEPRAGKALGNGRSLGRVGPQHIAQQLHCCRRQEGLTPRLQQRLDTLLSTTVHIAKGAVGKPGLVPWGTLPAQDEEADAAREDVGRRHSIAPELGKARLPWHGVLGQTYLTEVGAPDSHSHYILWLRSNGCGDPGLRNRGHVTVWSAIEVLSHGAEIAEWRARGRVTPHRHAEVHEPEVTILQQDVLEGDVAVTDAMLVEIIHGLQELPHVATHLRLHEQPRCDYFEEIAALSKLCDHPSRKLVRKDPEHSQKVERQIWLFRQLREDANLCQRIFRIGNTPLLRV
mmetsp:Transcript_34656/g.73815  ORF Transcript_34656/g.73815 Transcript_34656/m.73815 type:complete len:296 (+) Transcript_34656:257-1144(+)